ncbi:toprim domain-containing protein [Staphylococcus equorum]|uniref:DNA topoisomerase (ATP-hydrolyzing) n=1 Tax=Staphylococcus equorum TaxID=246432 RepID=A0A9X4LHV5_9STAP|nr:toprim domain-containing protein [Staphylococcus equorum]MDG0860348.1 toprim domain-containing protein [Staphylococcus equorum]
MTKHDTIRALNDREKARTKISIWYGSADNYSHGLKEVIANATDEVINNFDNGEVKVKLHDDKKTITVEDTGRGIPITGETDGVKNYDLLFRTLFAGTKYEQTEATSTGTNGVGNTVLCFTSSFFGVTSFYGGKKHSLSFDNGGEILEGLKSEKDPENKTGTTITFKLDPEVYTNTEYNPDEVEEIVKRFAVGSPKVTLKYLFDGIEKVFHFNSLDEYFKELVGNQSTSQIVSVPNTLYEDDGERTELNIALTTTPEQAQESYLNLTYLSEKGSFHDGLISGIRLFANKYCTSNKLFPKNVKSFLSTDIESSVSYVCVALSNKVEFQNQTKLSTNKKLYKDLTKKHVQKMLEVFSVENPSQMKKFINHILTVQKHNDQNQKAKAKLKKTLNQKVDGIGNKVEKLVDCKKHGLESELFIAEGNSALGSIVLARDAMNQAAYPLRGKILNCLKSDYPTIFKNQVITDLVKVLGCGIQADKKNKDLDSFDISKLRFGKIIISTDSDEDGYQICCLILTMFYRLMPDLIKEGRIYIAQTPLYEVKLKDDTMIYFYNENEKDEKLSSLKNVKTISRCKGLGELDSLTMHETAMNEETRNLVQVTVNDIEKMAKSLNDWMGIDHSNRKQYIAQNLYKYVENID